MKEGELKNLVTGYLIIKQNQGELMWLRLNAGMLIVGKSKIQLAPPGTADFLIIRHGKAIFIELKGDKGRLSDAQLDFGSLVKEHGADYSVVRSFEDLVALC